MQGPILLTGVTGQVGGQLLPLLQTLGAVWTPGRAELDLSDAAALKRAVLEARPACIVNCAAYTAVDRAEEEPGPAFAINAEAPRALGEAACKLDIPVIHFSTDYVFSGEGDRPWLETDATGPQGVYGASKLAGEQALAATGAAHMIFRTSWVYGATGNNFLLSILRLARSRETMNIVADQHGAPTWSRDLARLTLHSLGRGQQQAATQGVRLAEAVRQFGGVYHACGAGTTTWFDFAQEFLRLARLAEPAQCFATLVPIPSSGYPTAARRPLNSRLSCERLRRELGFTLPPWQESVAEVMAEVEALREKQS